MNSTGLPVLVPNPGARFEPAERPSEPEMVLMLAELSDFDFGNAIDRIPMRNVHRFVDAALAVGVLDPGVGKDLVGVIGKLEDKAGLFIQEIEKQPVATAICVHDEELAGIFEVASHVSFRRLGLARSLTISALKWAWLRGAIRGWLQVEADNEAALALYESLGFSELHRYRGDQPPVI